MLNLREELNEYIKDGSINWNRLFDNVENLLSMPRPEGKEATTKKSKELIGKLMSLGAMGQISFTFIDRQKKTRQRLILTSPKIIGDGIMAEQMKVETLEPAEAMEAEASETPMWIDNEWYRDELTGKIFRWYGRKDYIKDSAEYEMHLMECLENGQRLVMTSECKDKLTRVVPVKQESGIVYVNKESDV